MRPFHLVNVTWGDNHTGLYLDVSLPTQLLPENLPVLAERPGSVYRIFTPAEDARRIRATAVYRRLAEMLPTEIVEIELDGAAPHEILTQCQKQAIDQAAAAEAALVFLAPDTVLADGAFATLARLADQGKKAVMVPGVRLTKETFVPAFVARFQRHGYGLNRVGPRELVELALDHLHPTAKSLFWPAKVDWPSNLYWSLGREGFLCRCYHVHPLMVVAQRRGVAFSSTIDGDYVQCAGLSGEQIHVVEDSDELAIFEISSQRHNVGRRLPKPLRPRDVGRWAARHANGTHRHMATFATRVHCVECSPLWDLAQAESDAQLENVQSWVRLYDRLIRITAPALPAIRVLRRIAGRDTATARGLRWSHRFAVRLVTRGPRKALRIARDVLTAPFAITSRARNGTRPGDLGTAPAVSPSQFTTALPDPLPEADSVPARIAPATIDLDPTVIPPPSYTQFRAQQVYGEAFRRAFEYIKGTGVTGDIAEFGTLHGYTARMMATLIVEMDLPGRLWLYDSFSGLPEGMSRVDEESYEVKTNRAWFAGAMATPVDTDLLVGRAIARIMPASRLKIIKGYFDQALPRSRPAEPLALVHIDCDLYTSAKFVLDQLLSARLLQDGCVILCDDYNCNRANPNMGERRAMTEAFAGQRRFSYSPFFSYGWHGRAFLVHDREAVAQPHAEAA